MKLKTGWRIVGTVQTTALTYIGYGIYRVVSSKEYGRILDILSGDYPVEYKLAGTVILGLDGMLALSLLPTAFFVADGLVDTAKGTHHYSGMQTWKKLTRNPETKERIQKGIDDLLVKIEQPIFKKQWKLIIDNYLYI